MRTLLHSKTFKYIAGALLVLFLVAGATQLYATHSKTINSGTVISTNVTFAADTAEKANVRVETAGGGETSGATAVKSVPKPKQSVLLTRSDDGDWNVTTGYPVKLLYPYTHGLPWLLGAAGCLMLGIAVGRRLGTASEPHDSQEPSAEPVEPTASETRTS